MCQLSTKLTPPSIAGHACLMNSWNECLVLTLDRNISILGIDRFKLFMAASVLDILVIDKCLLTNTCIISHKLSHHI